ncbi:hypothetical protein B0H14DRAFT_3595881 [Mycena olivaceomarginata]|nr:hypothetical protein B0H14DRAFT_3595881 [Mycena olivaceomarginata]
MRVQQYQEMDDELIDGVLGEEYAVLQETMSSLSTPPAQPDAPVTVPAVRLEDEPSKPFRNGLYISANSVDFSPLVEQRRQHQTKYAEKCTRTKTTKSAPAPDSEESLRRQILRKFHDILKEDQSRAAGSTTERKARWNIETTTGAGNAANAAAAATAAATRRAKLFKEQKIPRFPLVSTGGVTHLKKLQIGDFGIVWTETGLRIARIEVMCSKGGGKNGKHNNIDEHVNISGISYLGTQVYEHFNGCQFRAITEVTASLQTNRLLMEPRPCEPYGHAQYDFEETP